MSRNGGSNFVGKELSKGSGVSNSPPMNVTNPILSVLLMGLLWTGGAARAGVVDLSQAPYSAAGDGEVDDLPALKKALGALEEGDTLFFPPGEYRFNLTASQIRIPAGVTLLGREGKTKIQLHTAGESNKHREFLRFSSDVTMEGLTIERAADYPLVMFPLFGNLENLTVRNCVILGNKSAFPGRYCHAFQVGVGAVEKVLFRRIEIRNCSFGLFQANDATGSLKSMRVELARFAENTASDLEFNSPRGEMEDITVNRCHFENNLCKTPSAGFAVGFANVKKGKVENCLIQNYGSEGLHVEDRSENIQLVGNVIRNSSLLQANGVIMIVNDSRKVEVRDNIVDARANTNKTHLILVTAGGDKFDNPSEVNVTGNILVNGPATRTWYLQHGSGPPPSKNLIIDPNDEPAEKK